MDFEPHNLLVINFGQLGDVVLSLPALAALRAKFPAARITVAVGKSAAAIIDLANVADDKIVVDRVRLRDSNKLWSVLQITKLVKDVRARDFDFIVDLHSLPETNILAFLSGANKRLLSQRASRSLDFLGSFGLRPPKEDKAKHQTDRYLDVLKPLGIKNATRAVKLQTRREDAEFVEKLWRKHKIESLAVGIFPGAGHPSRRWSLENFASLAEFLQRNEGVRPIVFLGPEERDFAPHIKTLFPVDTIVFDNLTLAQLIAAQANLSLFVSNDTGPMHLAAIAGAPIVLLMHAAAPQTYTPLASRLKVVRDNEIAKISVETVYEAAAELLRGERTSSLFA